MAQSELWRKVAIIILHLTLSLSETSVGVNFCCPDGWTLRIDMTESYSHETICVNRYWNKKKPLEGQEILVVDTSKSEEDKERSVKAAAKQIGNVDLNCSDGFRITSLPTGVSTNSTSGSSVTVATHYEVTAGPNTNGLEEIVGCYIKTERVTYVNNWSSPIYKRLSVSTGNQIYLLQDPGTTDWVIAEDILGQNAILRQYRTYYNQYPDAIKNLWRNNSGYTVLGLEVAFSDGIICSPDEGQPDISLTLEGILISQTGEMIESKDFCVMMAEEYTTNSQGQRFKKDDIIALHCDHDHSVRSRFKTLLQSLTLQYPFLTTINQSMIKMVDLDFEEFKSKLEYYIRKTCFVLGNKKDGVVDVKEMHQYFDRLPLKLFIVIAEEVFEYLDSDNKGFPYTEAFGIKSLISLPEPIYKFWQILDADQNEFIRLKEAKQFLQQTFMLIDTDKNCNINASELTSLLERINVDPTKRLAVHVVLQKYTLILNFFLGHFFEKADTDHDGKIKEEEVLKFSDFEFVEKMIPAAVTIGFPNMLPIKYLAFDADLTWNGKFERYGQRSQAANRERIAEMWMTALESMLEQPAYVNPPTGRCSD